MQAQRARGLVYTSYPINTAISSTESTQPSPLLHTAESDMSGSCMHACTPGTKSTPCTRTNRYQEHMSRRRRRGSVRLPRTPGCHRNTNSSAIPSKYGKCASIGTGYCHTHTRRATPSSAFEFVFRWRASCTLLRCLRRLICSYRYQSSVADV